MKPKFEDLNQEQRQQLLRKAFLHTRRKLRNKIKNGKVETLNWLYGPPNHAFLRYLRRYITIDKKEEDNFLITVKEQIISPPQSRGNVAPVNGDTLKLRLTWPSWVGLYVHYTFKYYVHVIRAKGKKCTIQYLSPEIIKLLT